MSSLQLTLHLHSALRALTPWAGQQLVSVWGFSFFIGSCTVGTCHPQASTSNGHLRLSWWSPKLKPPNFTAKKHAYRMVQKMALVSVAHFPLYYFQLRTLFIYRALIKQSTKCFTIKEEESSWNILIRPNKLKPMILKTVYNYMRVHFYIYHSFKLN